MEKTAPNSENNTYKNIKIFNCVGKFKKNKEPDHISPKKSGDLNNYDHRFPKAI